MNQQDLLDFLTSSSQLTEQGSLILNLWDKINEKSYLELGVRDNKNFDQIQANTKFSVDLNGLALYTGTTDEYFAQLPLESKFDIIFIDANHDSEFVIRDLINSTKHCNEWVLLHDCVPPTEKFTERNLCSDSFKVLYYLLNYTNTEIYVMDKNFGLTFVKMPAIIDYPDLDFATITYDQFLNSLSKIHRYTATEMKSILNT